MCFSLKILVGDGDADGNSSLLRALSNMGHQVVGSANRTSELVATFMELRPELVIVDTSLGAKEALEFASEIGHIAPTPIVILSDSHEQADLESACLDYVVGYVVRPLDPANLQSTLRFAWHNFTRMRQIETFALELQEKLHERKIVERAKGILMKHAGLSEAEAYRRLQKMSWDQNRNLVYIAELIIVADQAISPQAISVGSNADRRIDSRASKLRT